MVPAIAVPKLEPRLDTLRDSPEISPCSLSGKLDCTTLTEGVSITPRPRPIRSSPGANDQAVAEPLTINSKTAMPAIVRTNPARIRVRCERRLASRSAASEETRRPSVAAVKITPVWMAL
jgi:hypothetical protein